MKESKYITKNLKVLSNSYVGLENNLAWQDIKYCLEKELKKAQDKCKLNDAPEARGIWQLIDRLMKRQTILKKEVDSLSNENKKNKEEKL